MHVAPLDLADRRSVGVFLAGWRGPLHVLVNNAGVMGLSGDAHPGGLGAAVRDQPPWATSRWPPACTGHSPTARAATGEGAAWFAVSSSALFRSAG